MVPYAGGFIGEVHSSSPVIIIGSMNTGNILLPHQDGKITTAGGLIAYVNNSLTIIDSLNTGVIVAETSYALGRGRDETIITNSYSLGGACTEEELNTKEFYTETLGWSEYVWDLSELDVANGKYPKLK